MKKLILLFVLIFTTNCFSQADTILVQKLDSLLNYNQSLEHRLDVLEKNIDDVLWFQRVGDVALDNNRLSKVLSSFIDDNYFDIDGHNEDEISKCFDKFYNQKNENFSIIFARTIKGKGIEILEHSEKHHYRCPTLDGYIYKENNE